MPEQPYQGGGGRAQGYRPEELGEPREFPNRAAAWEFIQKTLDPASLLSWLNPGKNSTAWNIQPDEEFPPRALYRGQVYEGSAEPDILRIPDEMYPRIRAMLAHMDTVHPLSQRIQHISMLPDLPSGRVWSSRGSTVRGPDGFKMIYLDPAIEGDPYGELAGTVHHEFGHAIQPFYGESTMYDVGGAAQLLNQDINLPVEVEAIQRALGR